MTAASSSISGQAANMSGSVSGGYTAGLNVTI